MNGPVNNFHMFITNLIFGLVFGLFAYVVVFAPMIKASPLRATTQVVYGGGIPAETRGYYTVYYNECFGEYEDERMCSGLAAVYAIERTR